MWIFLIIIIVVIAGLIIAASASEKKNKKEASTELEKIKFKYDINLSYSTQAGCLAFCDDKQMIIDYRNHDKRLIEIKYENILRFEKNPRITGVSYWALTPEYTEYISGSVDVDQLDALMKKFTSIIDENYIQAEREYSEIAFVPHNAARVTVKGYEGQNVAIPNTIKEISSLCVWADDENLYMLPKFDLVDYKLNKKIYRIITIEKKSVVDITQEGNVHYTTEVRGGGGGGSSIKGAIVGGVIAGEAGAIIGSRKATDPITSSTKQIDDRTTNMKILDLNNNFCELTFEYNDYYALSKFIGN